MRQTVNRGPIGLARHGRRRTVLVGALVASGSLVIGAGPPPAPAASSPMSAAHAMPPPADKAIPGWLATYLPQGAKPKAGDVRGHVPALQFALRAGESAHPAVAAAGFQATYDGLLTIETPGKYRFGAEFEGGALDVQVFGGAIAEPVIQVLSASGRMSQWLDLPAGRINLKYRFTRAGDSQARLRAIWEKQGIGSDGFHPEPVPVAAVEVPPFGAADARTAMLADRGRVLLGHLGCNHCHEAEAEGGEALAIKRTPPLLGDAAGRLNADWIRKWITDSQAIKPGCGMPGVLNDVAAKDDAESIVHFLLKSAGGGGEPGQAAATEPATVEMGRKTFRQLGCVACHGALEGEKVPADPAPYESIARLDGKWKPEALAEFLMDPLKAHPGGRMPSLKLTKQEADLVATYLVNTWGGGSPGAAAPAVDAKKAEAGRAAFAARGCASCHTLQGGTDPKVEVLPTLKARRLLELRTAPAAGCLGPDDRKTPRYTLSSDDRAALVAAIEQAKKWTGAKAGTKLAVAPVDRACLTIGALGCRNCHEIDGAGGLPEPLKPYFVTLGEADLGDEGRIPPRLNNVGAKLNTPWLGTVLMEAGRARPYYGARMPQFGKEQVGALPAELCAVAGVWPTTGRPAKQPQPSDEMVQAGRKLVGVLGLNCISCHVLGEHPATGTPGPDVTTFAERLRYDWWAGYAFNPARYKPGTKMPSFYERGVAMITDVCAGDPRKQVDAMWAYFNLGEFAPLPEGLVQPEGLKIVVGKRPIVMRTFMKDAGSRGIAVGFPVGMGGVHFALDADSVRLVEAWTGDFLDATGVWAVRGGTPVGGQGSVVWKAPPGPALVIGEKVGEGGWPIQVGRDAGWAFRGYKLDDKGVPTFMYRLRGPGDRSLDVDERFEPTGQGNEFKRTFEARGLPAGATVWVNSGLSATAGEALGNVSSAKSVGNDKLRVFGFTVKVAGMPARFSVGVKP